MRRWLVLNAGDTIIKDVGEVGMAKMAKGLHFDTKLMKTMEGIEALDGNDGAGEEVGLVDELEIAIDGETFHGGGNSLREM